MQLVTNGLKLADFRPAGADDTVDIRLRLPEDRRTFATLDGLRIETASGSIPIANFVSRSPTLTTGILTRIDGAAHDHRRRPASAPGCRPTRCARR